MHYALLYGQIFNMWSANHNLRVLNLRNTNCEYYVAERMEELAAAIKVGLVTILQ